MKLGYIYKITSPTGKIYIGQTRNIHIRKNCYARLDCKKQKLLYNSLFKYGWNNHKFEVIYRTVCDEEELNRLEIFYIAFFKSYNTKYSLNLTKGGRGCYQLHTKEVRKKVGDKRRKPIYQFSREGILLKKWDSIVSVTKELGFNGANTYKFAKGRKGNHLYNFIWSFSDNLDWYYSIRKSLELKTKSFRDSTRKNIVQLTMSGEFVKEWNGIKFAAEYFGCRTSNIHQCFTGRSTHCKGFKWVYASEYYKDKS